MPKWTFSSSGRIMAFCLLAPSHYSALVQLLSIWSLWILVGYLKVMINGSDNVNSTFQMLLGFRALSCVKACCCCRAIWFKDHPVCTRCDDVTMILFWCAFGWANSLSKEQSWRKCKQMVVVQVDTFHTVPHWGQDKIATISQQTFSNAFYWIKMFKF